MEELSSRQEQILRAVVVEYVLGVEPVPSDLIARKYELGVRSATVRNEMAEITDLGLLEQPRTSAGRVPSDQGYRYFVDRLSVKVQPTAPERNRLREASLEESTTRELVHETTKALSRLTRQLAAAVTVRDADAVVRHVAVTALGPDRALLVVVLQNGHMENRVLDIPAGWSLEDLGRANEMLGTRYGNSSLRDLARTKPHAIVGDPTDGLMSSANQALRNIARDLTSGHVVIEGEEYFLAQPDFQAEGFDPLELMERVTDEEVMLSAVGRTDVPQAAATIGRENVRPDFADLTVLRRSFYVGDEEAGILAIVGPRRMDYDRNLGLLDFTAVAVSQTLTKLFRS